MEPSPRTEPLGRETSRVMLLAWASVLQCTLTLKQSQFLPREVSFVSEASGGVEKLADFRSERSGSILEAEAGIERACLVVWRVYAQDDE